MSASPEQQQRAGDPATPAQELADLAAAHPELRASIALNPATYAGLLDWLRQYGDAGVIAALEERERAAARVASPPPPPPAVAAPPVSVPPPPGYAPAAPGYTPPASAPAARFVEPTRALPLTGMGYDQRYLLALIALGVAGLFRVVIVPLALPAIDSAVFSAIGFPGASVLYWIADFVFAAIPSALVAVAILLLPAVRPRKMLALVLAAAPIAVLLLQSFAMIVVSVSRADVFELVLGFFAFLTLLFFPAAIAAWLLVRQRPAMTFALVAITIVPMILLAVFNDNFGYYYGLSPVGALLTVLMIAVLVGIAWLARLLAAQRPAAPVASAPVATAPVAAAPAFPAPPGRPGGPGLPG